MSRAQPHVGEPPPKLVAGNGCPPWIRNSAVSCSQHIEAASGVFLDGGDIGFRLADGRHRRCRSGSPGQAPAHAGKKSGRPLSTTPAIFGRPVRKPSGIGGVHLAASTSPCSIQASATAFAQRRRIAQLHGRTANMIRGFRHRGAGSAETLCVRALTGLNTRLKPTMITSNRSSGRARASMAWPVSRPNPSVTPREAGSCRPPAGAASPGPAPWAGNDRTAPAKPRAGGTRPHGRVTTQPPERSPRGSRSAQRR